MELTKKRKVPRPVPVSFNTWQISVAAEAKQTTTFQLSTMVGTANFHPKIHLDWQVKWCKVRIFWEGHKIRKNLPLKIWRYWVASNFKWKIFSNVVDFSEYPNFKRSQCPIHNDPNQFMVKIDWPFLYLILFIKKTLECIILLKLSIKLRLSEKAPKNWKILLFWHHFSNVVAFPKYLNF